MSGQRKGQPQSLTPPGAAAHTLPTIAEALEPFETWRRKGLKIRMRRCLEGVELHASRGDLDALKTALAHHRWETEMKHGRAKAQDTPGGQGVTITIVDDLGRRAVRVETGQQAQLAVGEREDDAP